MKQEDNINTDSVEVKSYGLAELYTIGNEISRGASTATGKVYSPISAQTEYWNWRRNCSIGEAYALGTNNSGDWPTTSTSNDQGAKKKIYQDGETSEHLKRESTSVFPRTIEKRIDTDSEELRMTRADLSSMCTMDREKIILLLINQASVIYKLLDSDISFHDLILLLRIIIRLHNPCAPARTTRILNATFAKKMLTKMKCHISTLHIQNIEEQQLNNIFWNDTETFWENLLTFFEMLFTLMPSTACEWLPKLTKSTLIVVGDIEKHHGISLSSDVTEAYVKFTEKLTSFASRPAKNENSIFEQPLDDFRDYAIYPSLNEITTRKTPFIRPIIKEGAYQSVEHYLDVQFRLLREDFVASLRDGICTYLENKQTGITTKKVFDVDIYEKVQFIGPYVSHDRIATLVQCTSKHRRSINEDSASFIHGSLICFTDDHFESIIFSTLVSNDTKIFRKGQIAVDISDQIIYGSEYSMVVCKVFFEPYFQTLTVLQSLNEHNFPFQKYIIEVSSEVEHPKYINKSTRVSIMDDSDEEDEEEYFFKDRICFKALSLETWPSADKLKLNPSQYKAFQNALTSEFCVIQGPPGTGKTYTTHRIVKFMLHNKCTLNFDGPILVLCFTNHALDQFLTEILKYTRNLVRVGGQSKSPTLSAFNLKHLRNNQMQLMKDKIYRKKRALLSKNQRRGFSYKMSYESEMFFENLDQFDYEPYFISGLEYNLNNNKMCLNKVLSKIQTFEQLLRDIMSNTGIIRFDYFKIFNRERMSNSCIIDWMLEEQIDDTHLKIEDEQYENDNIYRLTDEILNQNGELDHYIALGQISLQDNFLVSVSNYIINIQNIQIKIMQNEEETLPTGEYYRTLEKLNMELNYLQWRLQQTNNQIIPPKIVDNDIRSLSPDDRWKLYRYLLNLLKKKIYERLYDLDSEYRTMYAKYKKYLNIVDMKIMSKMDVIGMTTTGAARLQDMLQELNCPIVIVEEAAEVLEAHIVVSVTKACKHLILIGDHKQLRPNTSQYQLARKYNLDISLFERMVNNKLFCQQLDTQHRMRPEIAKLLVPTIYSKLDNHIKVLNYPPVLGVEKNLFFINHSHYEATISDTTSHINAYEASYLLKFATYLLMQGYDTQDITILTTYMGQLDYMLKIQTKCPLLKDLKIVTVDNFQGEESKIILLSLVRSNENANIGFLKTENRVCVALSRAKEGLFIIGNMVNLTNSSTLWQKIEKVLVEQESLGFTLVLKCQNHTNITKIETYADFDKITGGCSLICNQLLDCGHNCILTCHVLDAQHLHYECLARCIRKICIKDGHNCPLPCSSHCKPCKVPVATVLQCGHTQLVPCNVEPQLHTCLALILKELPCGHEADIPCSKAPKEHVCKELCNRSKKGCSTGEHRCPSLCSEECPPCHVMVDKKRTLCIHVHSVMCNKDVDTLICANNCRKTLPCGHYCKNKCSEECGGCNVMVTKIIDICGHSIRISCSLQPDRQNCQNNCPLSKSHGEPCNHKCCEPCPDDGT